ncbi:hypothetical protein AMTR_s00105p00032000 [Amborella trichopoda]|uniref:Uncharacterized protein n=1 Tax=Amborella trichopoda TaxID=13333 RepID=W1NZ85_AMBTC|nr:hypothetical protein AMTR_s00105p00032000 [Amborella trichopoda]
MLCARLSCQSTSMKASENKRKHGLITKTCGHANGERTFCHNRRFQELPLMQEKGTQVSDLFPGAYYLTKEEAAQFYWIVVFIPSSFLVPVLLDSGICRGTWLWPPPKR